MFGVNKPLFAFVFAALSVAACSSSSSPVPAAKPDDPGCGFAEHPSDALVSFVSGSSFDENLTMFAAYADGHVLVRDASQRTVQVGADRVQRLERDVVDTSLLDAAEGCYEADTKQNADGGGGASIVVLHDGKLSRYSHVDGDAPASLDRALAVARAFYDEVRAK